LTTNIIKQPKAVKSNKTAESCKVSANKNGYPWKTRF